MISFIEIPLQTTSTKETNILYNVICYPIVLKVQQIYCQYLVNSEKIFGWLFLFFNFLFSLLSIFILGVAVDEAKI